MKRAKHSLSNYRLTSMNMGNLVPIGLTEVLPGDTMQQATSALVRVSPLINPVMHPVHVKIHHWFVPTRIIWEDFEDFITGGPDGDSQALFPVVNTGANGLGSGTLADYLGIPPLAKNIDVSALPFRAYAMIFNEWYRDQDLQTELPFSVESGTDTTTNLDLVKINWEKDYFTSARPWTQKGPEVTLPLGVSAPIKYDPLDQYAGLINASTDGRATAMGRASPSGTYTPVPASTTQTLVADLSTASAASVSDLREAFSIQRFQEARARYGSRFSEYLAYLGVRSSDSRLQRPEYLGGGKQTIQFSEVLQTAPADGSPVGQLAGHGIGAMRTNRYRKFFEEHGYVLSFMSVKPKTIYTQGIDRHWLRRTKLDFWQKEFEHVGQQEIYNAELYAVGDKPGSGDDPRLGVFGYQDRYDEYRRTPSSVTGQFRSLMNDWHFAREFAAPPVLNGDFVESNPTLRPFADQDADSDHLWVMVNHSIQARRLVSNNTSSFIK